MPRMTPPRVSWDRAPEAIASAVRRARAGPEEDRPVVVGIGGPVGAGKSTLASRVGGLVLTTDDYLPDYQGLDPLHRDRPDAADLALLRDNLLALRAGRPTEAPVWCFHEHRRVGTRTLHPQPVIVVEGLHALHREVFPAIDVGVFVQAGADVRWARWEALEQRGERGFGVERAREHFETVAEPTFARYAEEYLARAHVVVVNDGERAATESEPP